MKYHTLFFLKKLGKMLKNLSSTAVMIGALRVNHVLLIQGKKKTFPIQLKDETT